MESVDEKMERLAEVMILKKKTRMGKTKGDGLDSK